MSIFDGLEKLINEHGSATILRERMELIREKHEALVAKLTEERDKANESLRQANGEIGRLKREVEKLRPIGGLTELEVSILKLLANARHELTARDVTAAVAQDITKVQYYLTKLEKARFVGAAHYYTGQASIYEIVHLGREYIVMHGHV